MAIQKENSVVLTGTFKTEQVSATFEKQVIAFESKNREGAMQEGTLETYIKPDLIQQRGIQAGDTIKAKGFLVFNFFTKQDGTVMSFPKFIASEIIEVEKAGAGGYAQPTQPAAFAGGAGVPPVPGAAPTAPGVAPEQAYAQPAPAAPGMMPTPPMPQ